MVAFSRVACFVVLATLLPASLPAGQVHEDIPFRQVRAVHFRNAVDLSGHELRTVRADRDGKVLINTNKGLLKGCDGRLVRYRELAGISELDHYDLELLNGKFVFLTSKMLLPLHGAGVDFRHNAQSGCTRVAAAAPGHYLLLSGAKITEIAAGKVIEHHNPGFTEVILCAFDNTFIVYAADKLARYEGGQLTPLPIPPAKIRGAVAVSKEEIKAATDQGLFTITEKSAVADSRPLPWCDLTCITRDGDGRFWVGSKRGAFSIDPDGELRYYAGRRWLQDDKVIDVHVDARNDVYILNRGGLSQLRFEMMTLADRAAVELRNLRLNHIRYGLVSDAELVDADYVHLRLHDTDNDGLWSSLYLAAESFRFAVTGDADARENALDGFDAIERLVTITPIPGFQARTFELEGFKRSDPERWRTRPQHDFEWKGHTSSDEIVGTFFFHSVFHDTVARDDPALQGRVASTVGAIMNHILDHNLYLVDVDGKPTTWGRWNPEYVNTAAVGGDRRLNSIEILSFLQLAYHVTGSQRFKDAFYDLVRRHGYAENTIRYLPDPMGEWNHSDDELYWLSYYNLIKHCFEEELRATFMKSIRAHVEATRRKRNPVWNFIFGGVTGEAIDLEGSIFILRRFPLDNRDWRMQNSHRLDIRIDARPDVEPEAAAVLPPDERRIQKWNSNEMGLDGGGDGNSPESGAEYLLPYWMGRYFGFISPPT